MSSRQIWHNRFGALALGLGLGLSVLFGNCWWNIFRYHNPSCSQYKPDFVSLYTGAKLMWEDRPFLYDLERQRLVQKVIDPSRGDWALPYLYPPFFAMFLMPLAWVSFSTAFALMTIVNFLLLLSALQILIRKLALNREQTNWLLLSTFCNYGVYYAMLEGQTSFLALLLLVLYVTSLRNGEELKAGLWSGLMFFKPQLLLVPIFVLVSKCRWRALGVALLVMAALSLLSYAIVEVEGVKQFLALSQRAMTGEDFLHIQPERMHNLRALAYYFFTAPWRDYIWWGASVVIGALVALYSRHSDAVERNSDASWIAIVASLILVTPHLHDHDLTFLIIPSAFLLKSTASSVPLGVAVALVVLGLASLINTIAFPYVPPLIPLACVIYLMIDLRRLAKGA